MNKRLPRHSSCTPPKRVSSVKTFTGSFQKMVLPKPQSFVPNILSSTKMFGSMGVEMRPSVIVNVSFHISETDHTVSFANYTVCQVYFTILD